MLKKLLLSTLLTIGCQPAFAVERILTADVIEGISVEKNYLGNKGHFEKNVNGVNAYADAAATTPVDGTAGSPTVTCTRSTTTPLSGVGQLLITKDAANRQGNGCSIDFTIDVKDEGVPLSISFDYAVGSGTYADGDIGVFIYNVTGAALITPVITAVPNHTLNGRRFTTSFTPSSSSLSYRLILHTASTSASAYTLKIDNVKVSAIRSVDSYTAVGFPWYVSATITGANPDLGTSAQASYVEITNAGLTMTPISGSAAVGTMCSSTNAATSPSTGATTCAAGSESLGGNFAIPSPGAYEVCMQFTHYMNLATTSSEEVSAAFQLIETPTNAQTLTLEGGARIMSQSLNGATSSMQTANPLNLCAIFNWTSAGTKGVRLMYEQSIAGTPDSNVVIGDANASIGQRNILLTVKKVF